MNQFTVRPPAPPTSKPPIPLSEEEYADGYWCLPPTSRNDNRRLNGSDDDNIVIVGTSSTLGGITVHKNRRAIIPRRITRPGSHLDSYSACIPLYDEVSAHTTMSTLSPQSNREK